MRFTFAYPSGRTAEDYLSTGAVLVLPNGQAVRQSSELYSVTFGPSNVTVAYGQGANSTSGTIYLKAPLVTELSGDVTKALFREKLTANRTYLLWPTGGNNAADGIVSPWKTLQYGFDYVKQYLDTAGFDVTFQYIGAATYSDFGLFDGAVPGGGRLVVQGTTPLGTIGLTRTGGDVITFKNGAKGLVQGLKFTTTTSGDGIRAQGPGTHVTVGNNEFGACAGNHIEANDLAYVTLTPSRTISGSALAHIHFTGGACVVDNNSTVTVNNTPAWTAYYAGGADSASLNCLNTTITGSATGAKFLLHFGATIRTDTNNPELFPGTTGLWAALKGGSYDNLINKQSSVLAGSNSLAVGDSESLILADASSGAVTINLPAVASSNGVIYTIKKKDSSGNTVTIDGNASETIDGATTLVLSTQWQKVTIRCDGTAWYVIG